jgi:collagenase-like PrtC family protease
MKPYFTIPADYSLETLKACPDTDLGIPVKELHGSLKYSGFGGGRQETVMPDCGEADFPKYVRAAAERGMEFNYLLNAACMSGEELTAEGQRRMCRWLEYLLECGVGKVTVTLPSLVEFILLRYPEFKVYYSIITGIDSVTRLRRLVGKRQVAGIYLHEAVHRDMKRLRAICRECLDRGIEVGMIVNVLCDIDCPWRQIHYTLVAHAMPGAPHTPYLWYYGTECKLRRLFDPKQALRLPWVRPDDIPMYLEAGVIRFKVGGRDLIKFGADFWRTVADYNRRPFEGNLYPLFLCYAQVEHQNLFHFDNGPRLSEYLAANFSGKLHCQECDDCGKCRDLVEAIAPDPDVRDKLAAVYRQRFRDVMRLDSRIPGESEEKRPFPG